MSKRKANNPVSRLISKNMPPAGSSLITTSTNAKDIVMVRTEDTAPSSRKYTVQQTPDGHGRMCVIRPHNPSLAIQMAGLSMRTGDSDLFAKIPAVVGDYTFLGYATGTEHVVDARGNVVAQLQPGDSFVGEKSLKESSVVTKRATPIRPTAKAQH